MKSVILVIFMVTIKRLVEKYVRYSKKKIAECTNGRDALNVQ